MEEIREQMDKPCHKRKNISEKKNKYRPIDFSKLNDYDYEFDKFNGLETRTNVLIRARRFLQWINQQKYNNIVVITHGNFLYPLFNEILNNNETNKNCNLNKTFFSNCEMRKTVVNLSNI